MFRPATKTTRHGLYPVLVLVAISVTGCGTSANTAPPSTAASSTDQSAPPAATPSHLGTAAHGGSAPPGLGGPSVADLAPLLAHRFVRAGLPIPGLDAHPGAWAFDMTPTGFDLDLPEFAKTLHATVTAPQPGEVDLTSIGGGGGCTIGATGRYGWSLSPSGSTLAVTLIADPCANRAAALPGRWAAILCRDPNGSCLGDLDAGTYPSQYFVHPFAYTVPAGWSNVGDWQWYVGLERQADYAREGTDSHGGSLTRPALYVFSDPMPEDLDRSCATVIDWRHGGVDSLVAWVASRKDVVATRPTSAMIGGHQATMLDVSVKRGWVPSCADFPAVPLIGSSSGTAWSYDWGVGSHERTRLIFVEVGGGHTVLVAIDAPDGTGFDGFVSQAMPIVAGFTIAP